MQVSTRGRVALSAMIDLALRQHHGPVTVAAIGRRLDISQSYLEQLFSGLRQHGLVCSLRGPGGGYTLDRTMPDITVADIVVAVDGLIDCTPPDDARSGPESVAHATHDLWLSLHRTLIDYLDETTLADLVEPQRDSRVRTVPAARETRVEHVETLRWPTSTLHAAPRGSRQVARAA